MHHRNGCSGSTAVSTGFVEALCMILRMRIIPPRAQVRIFFYFEVCRQIGSGCHSCSEKHYPWKTKTTRCFFKRKTEMRFQSAMCTVTPGMRTMSVPMLLRPCVRSVSRLTTMIVPDGLVTESRHLMSSVVLQHVLRPWQCSLVRSRMFLPGFASLSSVPYSRRSSLFVWCSRAPFSVLVLLVVLSRVSF